MRHSTSFSSMATTGSSTSGIDMYSLSYIGVDVEIHLEPGIYQLDTDSKSGKTWLCNILKGRSDNFDEARGVEVGYSYSDFLSGVKLELENARLAVLDRFALYGKEDSIREEIRAHKDTCIILIDIKETDDIIENPYGAFIFIDGTKICIR